jgi:hypothetical protein
MDFLGFNSLFEGILRMLVRKAFAEASKRKEISRITHRTLPCRLVPLARQLKST